MGRQLSVAESNKNWAARKTVKHCSKPAKKHPWRVAISAEIERRERLKKWGAA